MICIDRIWPNCIWPELVFQSVDRIWPNRIVFQVVVLVVCCCCACWCLLVLVGACWWLLSVCGGCVQDLGFLPLRWTALPLDRPKFRSFFLSYLKILSYFSLWEVFSLNFGGFFEAALKHARVVVCEPPAAPADRAAGARTHNRELQTHI